MLSRSGIHQGLRRLLKPQSAACNDVGAGFLNRESIHVQFFRLSELHGIFSSSGFRIIEQRARTVLCGPYVDLLFGVLPCRRFFMNLNGKAADVLPMSFAADWMFLLQV
jgi:hypothetical protein